MFGGMNILNLEQVTKFYTERRLFDKVDFSLQEGEKIGLIGINGTGKSTLLKIAAGIEEPDEGRVTKKNNLHICYLPQHPQFPQGARVLESVVAPNRTLANQWTIEGEAMSILTRLGFSVWDEEVAHLSGGQRKRLALASALLAQADLLVLDEPTNHLDSAMSQWLEEYLRQYRGTLLMVTHDRYFLDSVVNRIVELDQGKLYSYQTNYLGFLELKAQREEMEAASERKRQSILRVELEWMRRGARARSTKQKAHIKRYETLAAEQGPTSTGSVEMESVASRMGRTTVELKHLYKSYGEKKLIEDFSYIFLKNDRVGIIGPNGCGKSTLMKMMVGAEEPDEGQIEVGQTIRMGYFSQENEYMDQNLRVIDYIREGAEVIRTKSGTVTASQMAERFLFTPDMQYARIERLSGGEKRRLYLLRILMEAPNILLLDEPTNDLDIKTLSILEDYLDSFEGIVVAVSHDRYFLDRVVRRIFAFQEGGKIRQYEGGYTDYQAACADEEEQKIQPPLKGKEPKEKGSAAKSWQAERKKKLKFTWQEQRDFETVEEEIGKLEEQISDLEKEIEKEARNYTRLNQLLKEKEETQKLLDEKMDRWLYLTELAEKIEAQKES